MTPYINDLSQYPLNNDICCCAQYARNTQYNVQKCMLTMFSTLTVDYVQNALKDKDICPVC